MKKVGRTVGKRGNKMSAILYAAAFVVAFGAGAASKMVKPAWVKEYTVPKDREIGTVHRDLAYGKGPSNKFDLYLPTDDTKESYGLVVYLHAGGFTAGDKKDDEEMLRWLCSKGYVAAGINYTLRDEGHPEASVYSQSAEIRESIPFVIAEAKALGYSIDEMAIGGGSAGHCLAMLYGYRDADTSPVPVRMVFGAVGPSSFYPEDWGCYGFDQNTPESNQAAAALFGVMAGKEISPELFGTPAYDQAMKEISALLWVDENTAPSLMAYGSLDRVQSFEASIRLDEALSVCGVPHDYIVLPHSGHGLQNDDRELRRYYQKLEEYLKTYLPVK